MTQALIALWGLNAFDIAATWYGVKVARYAEEANPLMAWAIGHGLLAFVLLKCSLIGLGMLGMRRLYGRRPVAAISAAGLCLGVYAGIAAWHVYGFYLTRGI